MRVHYVHGVELTFRERRHQTIDELRRILCRRAIPEVHTARGDRPSYISIVAETLSPHDVQLDSYSVALELSQQVPALANEVRIEGTGKPTVGGDEQDRRSPHLRRLTEQREALGELRRVQPRHHFTERLRVRARRDHAVHRPLHLRGGHHLHRSRDLPRVLDGLDAAFELASLGHGCLCLTNCRFDRWTLFPTSDALLEGL